MLLNSGFQDEKVLEIYCTTMWIHWALLNCTCKNNSDGKFDAVFFTIIVYIVLIYY